MDEVKSHNIHDFSIYVVIDTEGEDVQGAVSKGTVSVREANVIDFGGYTIGIKEQRYAECQHGSNR